MNETTYHTIIELFRYSANERALFPYLETYTTRLDEWLQTHQLTEEQMFRYMVAGLFLLYQASVHQGGQMTTDPTQWQMVEESGNRQKEQVLVFNEYYGKSLSQTAEYMILLGITNEESIPKLAHGQLEQRKLNDIKRKFQLLYEGGLYEYVLQGHV